jgi:hypothetical protein
VSSEVSEFRSPHCKSGHESPSAAVDAGEMWCYPRTKTSRSRTQLQLDQIVRLMLETYLGTRVSVFRCFGVSPRMKRADMVCMCEVQVVSRPSDVEVKILVLRHLASLHHYCKACMSRRMLDIYARSPTQKIPAGTTFISHYDRHSRHAVLSYIAVFLIEERHTQAAAPCSLRAPFVRTPSGHQSRCALPSHAATADQRG